MAAALQLVSRATPLILVSAKTGEDVRHQFEKLTMAYFVEKPFDLDELVSLVNSLCKIDEANAGGGG